MKQEHIDAQKTIHDCLNDIIGVQQKVMADKSAHMAQQREHLILQIVQAKALTIIAQYALEAEKRFTQYEAAPEDWDKQENPSDREA